MDDAEFLVEDVETIVKSALQSVLNDTSYEQEKLNAWSNAVIDNCLKGLAGLGKPFKYVCSVILMQKTGAPLHTAAGAFWDKKKDGIVSATEGATTRRGGAARASTNSQRQCVRTKRAARLSPPPPRLTDACLGTAPACACARPARPLFRSARCRGRTRRCTQSSLSSDSQQRRASRRHSNSRARFIAARTFVRAERATRQLRRGGGGGPASSATGACTLRISLAIS